MQQSDKHRQATDEAIKDPRVEKSYGYKKDARPVEEDDGESIAGSPARPDIDLTSSPDPETVRDRSEFATFLNPSVFPADRERLLATAEQNDAPEWVSAALEALPANDRFATFDEVWEA